MSPAASQQRGSKPAAVKLRRLADVVDLPCTAQAAAAAGLPSKGALLAEQRHAAALVTPGMARMSAYDIKQMQQARSAVKGKHASSQQAADPKALAAAESAKRKAEQEAAAAQRAAAADRAKAERARAAQARAEENCKVRWGLPAGSWGLSGCPRCCGADPRPPTATPRRAPELARRPPRRVSAQLSGRRRQRWPRQPQHRPGKPV